MTETKLVLLGTGTPNAEPGARDQWAGCRGRGE